MLCFNPDARLTIAEACKHPVRDSNHILKSPNLGLIFINLY